MMGVLSASVANVMQATKRAAALPMASLLAWGMLWGTLFDAVFAWVTVGPPVIEPTLPYLGGVVYLGVAASAIAFMAYFSVIRMIGPGPAAYSSVIVPVIAMGISTVFEGYRWTLLAGAGGALAMAGLVIALTARKPST
jgi:drug/metabolite transporter (DMT)-like permease